MTIREIKTIYLNYGQLKHRPSTVRVEKHVLSKFSEYFTDNFDLDNLRPINVEMWLLQIYTTRPTYANLRYRILKAMFNWAVKNEMAKSNPFLAIKLPRKEVKNPVFIHKEEFVLILSHEPYDYMRNIYIIAFYTGLRLGELINLEWKDVYLNKKSLRVANTDTFSTKNGKDRVIPLCLPVYDVLYDMNAKRKENKYVVVRYCSSYISHRLLKAVRKTNLEGRHIHFHSLRHSFASNLVCKGVSLYAVKELLGHSDYATTQVYAHLQQQPLIDAVNMLD